MVRCWQWMWSIKRADSKCPGKRKGGRVVYDDETKLDVGVRRYRYMLEKGERRWGSDLGSARICYQCLAQKDPLPYFPVCVMAKEAFQKGKLAECTFATAYSP